MVICHVGDTVPLEHPQSVLPILLYGGYRARSVSWRTQDSVCKWPDAVARKLRGAFFMPDRGGDCGL